MLLNAVRCDGQTDKTSLYTSLVVMTFLMVFFSTNHKYEISSDVNTIYSLPIRRSVVQGYLKVSS